MSTEEYPEVSGDESGIVPPQTATATTPGAATAPRPPEWPKKIRTLTAAELDRLTIDGSGRFYWDGQLVNYEPAERKENAAQTSVSTEQSAMDIIDRAVHDLTDRNAPSPIEGADLPRLQHDPAEFDFARVAPTAAAITALPLDTVPAPVFPYTGDGLRLTLSRWQTIASIIALLAMLTGAAGVAAYGYVAMRDWSCRIDSKQHGCPPAPVAKPIARPEIPE